MESAKRRGWSFKFFKCLRPPTVFDDFEVFQDQNSKVGPAGGQVLTCIAVAGGGGAGGRDSVVIPKKMLNSSSEEFSVYSSDGGIVDVCGNCKNRKDRSFRRFSRVIKAIFFDTSLAKKMHRKRKRSGKESFLSDNGPYLMTEKNDKLTTYEYKDSSSGAFNSIRAASSIFTCSRTASTLCSCCSSSVSSSSMFLSDAKGGGYFGSNFIELKPSKESQLNNSNGNDNNRQNVNVAKKMSRFYVSNSGLFVLLLSLLVLVLCGKLYAIFCTSTWLFFAPRWICIAADMSANEICLPDIDSEEFKKKAIMETLLERNRRRLRVP